MPFKALPFHRKLIDILMNNQAISLAKWLMEHIGKQKEIQSDISDDQDLVTTEASHTLCITKPSEVALMEYLDTGSFGKTYSAVLRNTNERVAVKVLQALEVNANQLKHELDLLQ